MDQVPCPHCGFLNFTISAYCGRCERPLPLQAPSSAESPAAPPPAAPPAETAKPQTPTAVTARKPPPPPPPAEQSPPPPPRPAPTPIERASSAPNEPAPVSRDPQGVTEVPVAIASAGQMLLGRLVDGGLATLVGAAVCLVEVFLLGHRWSSQAVGLLDSVAEWLYQNSTPAWHGLLVAVAVGALHNLVVGRGSGRTLGRMVTGTVLVRASGAPLTWVTMTIRAAASLLSLACFGAGYFWPIVDRRRRTWHDILAGTVLVNRRVRLDDQKKGAASAKSPRSRGS